MGYSQNQPKINLETVRKDILNQEDYLFPEDYLLNLAQEEFNVHYLNNYCLVHIEYKNTEMSSSEPFSYVAIYSLEDNLWVFDSSFPYYYDLQLIDEAGKVFLSNNLFCSMDGDCNRFVEISKFDGNKLSSLASYSGYNNTLYYDRLLVFEKMEEVQKATGDTIAIDTTVSNIRVNMTGLESFELHTEIVLLKDIVSDSLQLQVIKSKRNIEYDR